MNDARSVTLVEDDAAPYATDRSPTEIATASLDRKGALSAVWISQGTLFTHRREPQPRVIIGAR